MRSSYRCIVSDRTEICNVKKLILSKFWVVYTYTDIIQCTAGGTVMPNVTCMWIISFLILYRTGYCKTLTTIVFYFFNTILNITFMSLPLHLFAHIRGRLIKVSFMIIIIAKVIHSDIEPYHTIWGPSQLTSFRPQCVLLYIRH